MSDKPNGERLSWTVLETTNLYKDTRFSVRRDRIRLPDGDECTFTYPVKSGAVFILPITPAGELVLIRQYRYIVDAWLWEIPAGSTHDFDGSDYSDLVRRELWEEVGGQTDAIYPLGRTFAAPGFTTIKVFGYLATGVTLTETNHPENTEFIEIHPTSIPDALDLLRTGEHTSAIDAYFVLQQEPLLRAINSRVIRGRTFEDVVTTCVMRDA
ncbi:MAG: NUDIX domain-containing protein [Anaerolineae bacterium]